MIKYILILMIIGSSLFASGSRPNKPGKPPRNPDITKYNSGKALFTGKKELPEVNEKIKETQLDLLKSIESKVPESARKKYSILPLAGRVSKEEIEDLKYYLIIRYKIEF